MSRRRLYLIELFAGSHSVSRALRRCIHHRKLHVLSVDNDPSSNPTMLTDINTWDYKDDIARFLQQRRRAT